MRRAPLENPGKFSRWRKIPPCGQFSRFRRLQKTASLAPSQKKRRSARAGQSIRLSPACPPIGWGTYPARG